MPRNIAVADLGKPHVRNLDKHIAELQAELAAVRAELAELKVAHEMVKGDRDRLTNKLAVLEDDAPIERIRAVPQETKGAKK